MTESIQDMVVRWIIQPVELPRKCLAVETGRYEILTGPDNRTTTLDLIEPRRIKYSNPGRAIGGKFIMDHGDVDPVELLDCSDFFEGVYLTIGPPPKKETLEEWLKRMPDPNEYKDVGILSSDIRQWKSERPETERR